LKLKPDDKIMMSLWSLFGRNKNSLHHCPWKRKSKQEGFWARKLIFLPLLMWQRMQRS